MKKQTYSAMTVSVSVGAVTVHAERRVPVRQAEGLSSVRLFLLMVGVMLWLAPSVRSATNVIQNGSFENDGSGTFTTSDSELPGTAYYAGAAWGVYTATNWSKTSRVWFVTKGTESFPDGNYAYSLDGSDNGGKDVLAQGGLSLEAGKTYNLTFALWGPNTALTEYLDVRFTYGYSSLTDPTSGTGVLVLDNKTTVGNNGAFENVTVQFTPTVSTNYALQFIADTDAGESDGDHIWMDNVVLREVTSPFSWNVGNGVWDTVTTNWLSGGTPSVWGSNAGDAIFTNRSDAVTVTVEGGFTAETIRVGNGSNNWAKYTLLGGAGKSITATKFVTQFTNDAPANSTILTNLTMTLSGKLAAGRSWLILAGNSAVSADKFVTSDDAEFYVAGADPGTWGNLWLKDTATLRVTNGIAVTRPNRILLDGGSLYAPYLKISDLGSVGNSSVLNGGRIVALPSAQNTNFIQFAFGVNLYVSTSGAVFDSDTNTITIRTPLIHDSTGAATDGGLVKLGTGTLTFSGATNTYNGMTIVSNGTLRSAAFDNSVSSNGSVAIVSGAILDLAGYNQTVRNLMGGGIITNLAAGKTMTVTGTNTFTGTYVGSGTTVVSGVISSAGPGFIGQITMNNILALSGTLQVDVTMEGTSDLLVTQGTLDLAGARLSVVDTNNLNIDKKYVVLSYSNAPTGSFDESLLPLHWITQNDAVNKRILLRRANSGFILTLQ
jgi:autotransporter-associated beta strand protein